MFTVADHDFLTWRKQLEARRRFKSENQNHLVRLARRSLDKEVLGLATHGDYGVVLMGRHPQERWRERLIYNLEEKVSGIIGSSPNQHRALVAVDLSGTSLLVLRYLEHFIIAKPYFKLNFVHVLTNSEKQAQTRWTKLNKIMAWGHQFDQKMIPSTGDIAADLLGVIKTEGFGTVIMGKRGLSGIKRLLLGSVSAKVLHGLDDETVFLID